MKEFDWNKPFTTKDGKKARLLGILERPNRPGASNHVVAVAGFAAGEEELCLYNKDGSYYAEKATDSDLVNVSEKMKVHIQEIDMDTGAMVAHAGLFFDFNCEKAAAEGYGVIVEIEKDKIKLKGEKR